MATKQDYEFMENTGIVIIKAIQFSPIWVPIAGIVYWIWKPEVVNGYLEPYIPAAKTAGINTIWALIIAAIFMTLRFLSNRYREKKRYQYYRIVPHADQKISAASVHEMMGMIAGYERPRRIRLIRGREWFQWLIKKDEEGIKFYIGFPQDRKTGILRTINNAYPKAELHEDRDVKFPKKTAKSGRMTMEYKGINEVKPLASYSGKNGIGNLISYMEPGSWIDISFSPSSPFSLMKKIKKSQKKMKNFHSKMSEMDSFEKNDLKSVSRRLSGRDQVYRVSVSIGSESKQNGGVVHSIATNIGSLMNDENGLKYREYPNAIKKSPYPFGYKMDWTGRELANLILLPDPEHEIFSEVPHLEKGQKALKPDEMSEGFTIGWMIHPTIFERLVRIPLKIFKEHFFASGKTGSGKSSLVLMILQSMIDGWVKKSKGKAPGFTLFDPARETTLTVLSRLVKAETEGKTVDWSRVHYYSLTKSDYPIPLNMLHISDGELAEGVKNNIMNILDTAITSSANAPKMKRWIELALLALIQDEEPQTILGVNNMFFNRQFRRKIVNRIKDPMLKQKWMDFDPKGMDATLDAIQNRMNAFESSEYMRRMFGQTEFGLKLKKWMDEGHIVLIDMKDVDDQNIALTVGHMVTQYYQVAVRERPSGSMLHCLVVDEAHLAPIRIMERIVAVARKNGLGLGVVTQYMDQLPQWLREAIKGNMGTILSGTQGPTAAEQIEDMTGTFSKDYLQKLPSNTVAAFTKEKHKDGDKITTVTVKTEPPFLYKKDGSLVNHEDENEMIATFDWLESIGLELQKRDFKHYEEIDKEIYAYLGIEEIGETKKENEALFPGLDVESNLLRGDADHQETTNDSQNETNDDNLIHNGPPRQEESDIMLNDEKVSNRDLFDETDEEKNKSTEEGEKKTFTFF